MNHEHQPHYVLSVYPSSRGFAFVLFEGPESPYDWGIKEIRKKRKNDFSLKHIQKLVERYRPDGLVIEDYEEKGSKRSDRIRGLYKTIEHFATTEHIEVFRYSRSIIRDCFAHVGARTRYEIAQAIARQIPAFSHRLPKLRKIWMSEDPKQSLFDAIALGIVHYCLACS
jgi:hypothetical protein